MHIGHGGGTYLRADVLARSLRAEGHQVAVACGTDAYENWVLAAAAREGRPVREVCQTYHEGIYADLTALGVRFDAWIDPLVEEHRQPYLDLHTELFQEVTDHGTAQLEAESIPYTHGGSALMGTFIAGGCPTCGAPADGSSCTACGEHFQPSQLKDPHPRLSDSPITWRQEKNWFLSPRSGEELLEALDRSGLAAEHRAVAARYLERSGGRIRLSGPGKWGVTSPLLPEGRVLSNSYYLYAVYAARQVAAGAGAFDADSDAITVGVFGTDNSTPGLVVPGLYAQGTRGRLKAFDHTVVNGMLDLDERKCSTSKRYGIWLADGLGSGIMTADELRFALAGVELDSGRANLDLAALAATVSSFRRLVRDRVVPALRAAGDAAEADPALLAQQRAYLQPATLHLPRAREVLLAHLRSPNPDPSGWLATLAMLSAPLTPHLSGVIAASAGAPPTSRPDPELAVRPVLGGGELTALALETIVRRGGDPAP
jgi:methionyl-tRNA synthetase